MVAIPRGAEGWGRPGILTFSEVVQVEQLVVPLGDNADSVFEEGDHDQKAANGW